MKISPKAENICKLIGLMDKVDCSTQEHRCQPGHEWLASCSSSSPHSVSFLLHSMSPPPTYRN